MAIKILSVTSSLLGLPVLMSIKVRSTPASSPVLVHAPLACADEFFRTSGVPGLLEAALEGYACTCFAYGQTGSGKTYTLSGEAEAGRAEHNEGLTRRALRYVFHRAAELRSQACSVKIRASYCEVYNEQVFDLLTTVDTSVDLGAVAVPLQVRGGKRGFFADGITIAECDTYGTAAAVLQRGHTARRVRSHKLNEHSSRSHSLFTLEMEVTAPPASGQTSTAHSRRRSSAGSDRITQSGKVVFVDLAGSERLKRSGAAGDGRKETGAINKSLFALAKVISAVAAAQQAAADAGATGPPEPTFDELMAGKLRKRRQSKVAGVDSPGTPPAGEGARASTARPSTSASFIPYRDSTLTKLLMNSLGGDCRTLMIACVSPAHVHLEESLNTLAYAQRAAKIRNSAVLHTNAGKVGGAAQGIISNLKAEIEQLRAENAALRASSSSPRESPSQVHSPYRHPGTGLEAQSPASFGVLSPQQRLLDQRMHEASSGVSRSEPASPPSAHYHPSPQQTGHLRSGHQPVPAHAVQSEPPRATPQGALQMDSDIRVSAITQAAGMSVLGSGRGDNARRGGPNGPRRAPLKRSTSAVPVNTKKTHRAHRAAAAVAEPPSTAPSGPEGVARRAQQTGASGPDVAMPASHGRRAVAFQEHDTQGSMSRKLPAPTPITSPVGSPGRGAAGEGFVSPSAAAGKHSKSRHRSSYGSAFSPDGSSPVTLSPVAAAGYGRSKAKAKHGRRSTGTSDGLVTSPMDTAPGAGGQLSPAQLDALIAEEMHKVEALKAAKSPQGKAAGGAASNGGKGGISTPTRAALAEKQRLQYENDVLRKRVKEAKATARTARGTRIPKIRKDDWSADDTNSPLQSPAAHPSTSSPNGMQLLQHMPLQGQYLPPHAYGGLHSHGMGVPQLPLMSPGPDPRWGHQQNAQAPTQWASTSYPVPSGLGPAHPRHAYPQAAQQQPFSQAAGYTPHPGKTFDFNVPLSPAARGEVGPQHQQAHAWSQAPGLGVGLLASQGMQAQYHPPHYQDSANGSVHSGLGPGTDDYGHAYRLGTADTMGSFHTANMELVPASHTPVPPQPAPTPLPREHDLYGHPAGVGGATYGSQGLAVQMQQQLHHVPLLKHDPLARWQGSFRDGGVAESMAVQVTTSMGSSPHDESDSPGAAAAHIRHIPSPVPQEVGSPINAGRLTPRSSQRPGSPRHPPSRTGSSIAREQAEALQRKLDAMARREMHLLARMDTLERNIVSPAPSRGASPKAVTGGVWQDSGRVMGQDSAREGPAELDNAALVDSDGSAADDSSPTRPGAGLHAGRAPPAQREPVEDNHKHGSEDQASSDGDSPVADEGD